MLAVHEVSQAMFSLKGLQQTGLYTHMIIHTNMRDKCVAATPCWSRQGKKGSVERLKSNSSINDGTRQRMEDSKILAALRANLDIQLLILKYICLWALLVHFYTLILQTFSEGRKMPLK